MNPVLPPKPSTSARGWVCELCDGSALVFARKKNEDSSPVIFRCTCYRGENDRRKFPSWRDAGADYLREERPKEKA